MKNILKIVNEYETRISETNNKEDMKTLVMEMFQNDDINDIDFCDLIYMDVIPKLKEMGVNMEYDDESEETNYEKVIRGNY